MTRSINEIFEWDFWLIFAMESNCVAAQQAETAFVGRKFEISHTSQTSGHFRNNFAPSQLNKLRLARSGWCEHSCRKRQFSKSLIFPITY